MFLDEILDLCIQARNIFFNFASSIAHVKCKGVLGVLQLMLVDV